ncbi:MAG: gamma-glutamyl-gamma-aminobutyrate hydrolase family protein [Coleofasciculaceae cyanobacterium]
MNLKTKSFINLTKTTRIPPVIGITSGQMKEDGKFYSPVGYAQAVQLSGGIPVLLPPLNQDPALILQVVDGLVFSGGGDLDPVHYDGLPHPSIYGVDPGRDEPELALAKLAVQSNKPILGICRGLEVLMVASGGDLVAHVPEEFGEDIAHRRAVLEPCEHSVKIIANTQLAKIIGSDEVTVVSWHHQAVRTVPANWRISALAPDGLIEALEHERHPFALALQWHPELLTKDPAHLGIFQAFIKAASLHKACLAA